jgi:hypothetical protein
METFCKIHVLKRFSAFEWVVFLFFANLYLYLVKFDYFIISLGVSFLFVSIFHKHFFDIEKYSDLDLFSVKKLINRRYKDLLYFIFLMSVLAVLLIFQFFMTLVPLFITVLLADEYGYFVGILAGLFFIILPASIVLIHYDASNPNVKFPKIIGFYEKLSYPANKIKILIEKINIIP